MPLAILYQKHTIDDFGLRTYKTTYTTDGWLYDHNRNKIKIHIFRVDSKEEAYRYIVAAHKFHKSEPIPSMEDVPIIEICSLSLSIPYGFQHITDRTNQAAQEYVRYYFDEFVGDMTDQIEKFKSEVKSTEG